MGTAKCLSPSALAELFTVTPAVRGNGHRDGAAPIWDGGFPEASGSHGQLSWGENATVMEQLCCGPREKDDPKGFAQVSCSVKLGSPLKSLDPLKGSVAPARGVNDKFRSNGGDPEGSVFVSVIVCVVGNEPTA
jgi:hypothetical protein